MAKYKFINMILPKSLHNNTQTKLASMNRVTKSIKHSLQEFENQPEEQRERQ